MDDKKFMFEKNEKFLIGLNWKSNPNEENIDMDLMAIVLDENEKMLSKTGLIFYNNLFSDNGAIFHTGDNSTGNFEHDDEAILINLELMPKNVKYIRFVIANLEKNNNFDSVSFRIAKMKDLYDNIGDEMYSYKLKNNDFHIMYIAEIEQKDEKFVLNIKNNEVKLTIAEILEKYNIQIE